MNTETFLPALDARGAVLAARGFRAIGVACGIKPSNLDLALLAADTPVNAAGVFTTSRTAGPPVTVCRAHLEHPQVRAVIVTSGCANAGTGEAGLQAARAVAQAVAQQLGCAENEVLPCSTGVIGTPLPVDKITAALPAAVGQLARNSDAAHLAARAICTTDTRPKEALQHANGYLVGGMAKGAGMVRPNMATMMAFITTDAVVRPEMLQRSLRAAVDVSFNALNIDGCQSTNDTVLVLASGASGVAPDEHDFTGALTEVCVRLARQIAADAEGATRVVTLRVHGASDARVAREIGKFVTDSDLVRSSLHSGDPNWGRVLAAVGVCGQAIDTSAIDISYEGVPTCVASAGVPFDRQELQRRLARGNFTIDLRVGHGLGSAEVITVDLSPEYVRFNAELS